MPKSPDISQNTDRGNSNFRISGQSLINESCRNSRTSNDVDMKPEPVTKPEKRNTVTSKDFDHDVMSPNFSSHCHFSNLWPIWSNPEVGFWMHDLLNLHFH